MSDNNIAKYLNNWWDEKNSEYIYHQLSILEKDKRLAEIYEKMSIVEQNHAKHWEDLIVIKKAGLPQFGPSFRVKLLLWIAKRFGPSTVIQSLQIGEQKGTQNYTDQKAQKSMVADESSHARILNQMARSSQSGVQGGVVAMFEGGHKATGGNALRAAVLGANDGMVSNLSLVMGVAGAALDNHTILITGLAGLLAGACSMALGEWLSVQSSRELYLNQIAIEKEEIKNAPKEETQELSLIYQARGFSETQANLLADQIMQNQENAIDTLAREELGINPEELGGSAWEAAITSFFLFALGAIVPVAPFIFFTGITAILISIGASVIGLFIIGSLVTLFTGKTVLYSGLRMVIFGLLAAGITFLIGRLIGVGVTG